MRPVVLALEQAERFLGEKLSDAGEIFHAKALQNLGAGQFAFARTQRAFKFLGRCGSHRCAPSHAAKWGGVEIRGKPGSTLLLANQQTGIRGVDGHQGAVRVADGVEAFAGASSYVVLIIAHRLGSVAVSRCYRADDPTVAIEDEI